MTIDMSGEKPFEVHDWVSIKYGHKYDNCTGHIESINHDIDTVDVKLSYTEDHKVITLSIDDIELI